MVLHTGFHIAAGVSMYITGNSTTSNSLWAQTCDAGSMQMSLFPHFNFSTFCLMQVNDIEEFDLIIECDGNLGSCVGGK